jgi:type I restriction enzyme S subunit
MNLNQYSVAAAQPGLAVDRILNLFVPVPPKGDQELIPRHITIATSGLVDAASRASHEVALLREYRTRLIADAVTGKLDVREAAASLPDEAEESEPLNEPEIDSSADDLDENEIGEVAAEAEA